MHRAVGDGRKGPTRSPLDALANREWQVFHLIGESVQTAEIAEQLYLGAKTYRERIRPMLDSRGGTELADYATRWVLENG